jgi:hypothetical protein
MQTMTYILEREPDGYALFVDEAGGLRLLAHCSSGKHAHEVMTAWTWVNREVPCSDSLTQMVC